MASALIIGSIAVDRMIHVQGSLQAGSHHQGRAGDERIGGGAANTAMALARGGVRAMLVSAVGSDAVGQELLRKLDEVGVDTRLVERSGSATTLSLVLLDDQGERTIVNLARASVPLAQDLAELDVDICYVRSTDPALTPIMQQMVWKCVVIAQIPPVNGPPRPATILTASRSDLEESFMVDPFANGQQIGGSSLQWVILTDGPNGAVAYGPNEQICQAVQPRRVVDSTGAGDVFVAGLIKGLCDEAAVTGPAIARAMVKADHWGGLSVTYSGTVPPLGFPDNWQVR